MLTLTDLNVGDILVTKDSYSNNYHFYQIVGSNRVGTLRYVEISAPTKVSGRQVTWSVKTYGPLDGSKPITITKPLKDGFVRIDKNLVERYDPTRVYSLPWYPAGSDHESDYSSYVDSDFED